LGREWVAIDTELEAREAYLQRRETYVDGDEQTTLLAAADGGNSHGLHTGVDRSTEGSDDD